MLHVIFSYQEIKAECLLRRRFGDQECRRFYVHYHWVSSAEEIDLGVKIQLTYCGGSEVRTALLHADIEVPSVPYDQVALSSNIKLP